MYLKKTFTVGRTVEVHDSYSPRYGKSITRGDPVGRTPEAQANYNDKISKRHAARVIAKNFGAADCWVGFNYYEGWRPSPAEAAAQLEKALRQIRNYMRYPSRWQKRRGRHDPEAAPYPAKDLKYMKATAIGSRGAIHHHVVLNTNDLELLREVWPYGPVNIAPLDPSGNYAYLARYLCGQGKGEPGGQIVILGNRWSGSRNLTPPPAPKVQEIDAVRWREPPRPKKGYIIDPDSIDAGVNPVNGMPYLFYRMVRIDPPRVPGKTAAEIVTTMQDANRSAVYTIWTERYAGRALRVEQGTRPPKRKQARASPPPGIKHERRPP